jgi:uncharacterized membrane protein
MSPWIAVLAVGVFAAHAVTIWWLARRLNSTSHQIRSEIALSQDRASQRLRAVQDELELYMADQASRMLAALEQRPPPEHPLTGLAFLPTDQSSADLERQVKRAEDHAIQDGERIRYSSRPSGISERPSSREASTRRVPRSGPS